MTGPKSGCQPEMRTKAFSPYVRTTRGQIDTAAGFKFSLFVLVRSAISGYWSYRFVYTNPKMRSAMSGRFFSFIA